MTDVAIEKGSAHPLSYFDRIVVINLRSRVDRRRDLEREFRRVGFDPRYIEWFDAVRPEDRGDFESIGARGCFLSHLGVLETNADRPPERLLILEDDVSFSPDFVGRLRRIVAQLETQDWDMFYGGGLSDQVTPVTAALARVPEDAGIQCAHFVGFRGHTIARVAAYLAAQLGRPAGDPAGGPMHVDGSYSWARKALGMETLMAAPEIAFQRSSRSDIAEGQWWDRVAGMRELVGLVRRLKNRTRA